MSGWAGLEAVLRGGAGQDGRTAPLTFQPANCLLSYAVCRYSDLFPEEVGQAVEAGSFQELKAVLRSLNSSGTLCRMAAQLGVLADTPVLAPSGYFGLYFDTDRGRWGATVGSNTFYRSRCRDACIAMWDVFNQFLLLHGQGGSAAANCRPSM